MVGARDGPRAGARRGERVQAFHQRGLVAAPRGDRGADAAHPRRELPRASQEATRGDDPHPAEGQACTARRLRLRHPLPRTGALRGGGAAVSCGSGGGMTAATRALLAALLAALSCGTACAESPERPLRAIVPFTTGGPNDILA